MSQIREIVESIYADWDLLKRLVKEQDKNLYERWKAGGFIVDENIVSMYPNLVEVCEVINDEEDEEDEEDED